MTEKSIDRRNVWISVFIRIVAAKMLYDFYQEFYRAGGSLNVREFYLGPATAMFFYVPIFLAAIGALILPLRLIYRAFIFGPVFYFVFVLPLVASELDWIAGVFGARGFAWSGALESVLTAVGVAALLWGRKDLKRSKEEILAKL